MQTLPNCCTCGKFHRPTDKGACSRLDVPPDYWNGPDGETYQCAECTAKYGPLAPCSGCRPETVHVVQ